MKSILKFKYIFFSISIIVLAFFWGKRPATYSGIFEGLSIIEHIILFILFSISLLLNAIDIYKKYKREKANVQIKKLIFELIIIIISFSILFGILKSCNDMANVSKLKNVCEEKLENFTYNLTLEGYPNRLKIEYEDFRTDPENLTYEITYRIKDSGVIIFEFKKKSNKLIGVEMIIQNESEEYKSPIILQSTLLRTWDDNTFEKEYASYVITKMLVEIGKQGDETIKKCDLKKEEYKIGISYFSDWWWTFSIYEN